MERYRLIGCSECENLQIIDGEQKTSQCTRCSNRIDVSKAKVFFDSDSKEEVESARGLFHAKRTGNEEQFRELIDSGELTSITESGGLPTIEKAILSVLKNNTLKEEEIVERVNEEYGFDKEDIRDEISVLVSNGELYCPRQSEGLKIV